jgi:hypothetical protein
MPPRPICKFSLKLHLSCPGLLTAVHTKHFHVLNHRELLFNDFGDRVAQLLHVESAMPYLQNRSTSCVQQQSLIVNTHLVFPHDHSLSIVRLKQVGANDYPVSQYFSRGYAAIDFCVNDRYIRSFST